MIKERILGKLSEYRFEIRHITVLFIVFIMFQVILAFVQKSSLDEFLVDTQNWYKKHSAERLAIVTSTSIELMFENLFLYKELSPSEQNQIISSFNVIFKQQLLQKSVNDICLFLIKKNSLYTVDSGQELYSYLSSDLRPYEGTENLHTEGVELFLSLKEKMESEEVIYSGLKNNLTFNILVPFVPNGEYIGVMYMKITPDFSFVSQDVSTSFDNVSVLYSSLIFLGLIGIYFVSSQAVKERNKAQKDLFEEHQEHITEQIQHEKESLFTKRIYHTHHKAEKIMGFIKHDIRQMDNNNIEAIKTRVITYSNFISRIIYDMKWYDQPVNTIINNMFRTEINKVINFIVDYLFLRISSKNDMFNFNVELDENLPLVNVNEFVVWEILEPIIQNSIDHGNKSSIDISIKTEYDSKKHKSRIIIADNGVGIKKELLETDKNGVLKIFLENQSTKEVEGTNSGYGCYIAYQMAVEKCGWDLDVENLDEGGCKFTLTIQN
ncbi:MAG: ATP-binding protein [Melioribacteraceae bacterium]|nr:ATP-binding protein [Melioribacteraceae bacterium]